MVLFKELCTYHGVFMVHRYNYCHFYGACVKLLLLSRLGERFKLLFNCHLYEDTFQVVITVTSVRIRFKWLLLSHLEEHTTGNTCLFKVYNAMCGCNAFFV